MAFKMETEGKVPKSDCENTTSEDNPDGLEDPECPICLQKCVHPVKLPCSHIFCYLCIKGVAYRSKKCALCRTEIPVQFLTRPDLVKADDLNKKVELEDGYNWYYEGNNGWWQYDERTTLEVEEKHKAKVQSFEILIAGFLYVIDFENMVQYRRNEPGRRRQIKRDTANIPVKGIAGLKRPRTVPVTEREGAEGVASTANAGGGGGPGTLANVPVSNPSAASVNATGASGSGANQTQPATAIAIASASGSGSQSVPQLLTSQGPRDCPAGQGQMVTQNRQTGQNLNRSSRNQNRQLDGTNVRVSSQQPRQVVGSDRQLGNPQRNVVGQTGYQASGLSRNTSPNMANRPSSRNHRNHDRNESPSSNEQMPNRQVEGANINMRPLPIPRGQPRSLEVNSNSRGHSQQGEGQNRTNNSDINNRPVRRPPAVPQTLPPVTTGGGAEVADTLSSGLNNLNLHQSNAGGTNIASLSRDDFISRDYDSS